MAHIELTKEHYSKLTAMAMFFDEEMKELTEQIAQADNNNDVIAATALRYKRQQIRFHYQTVCEINAL